MELRRSDCLNYLSKLTHWIVTISTTLSELAFYQPAEPRRLGNSDISGTTGRLFGEAVVDSPQTENLVVVFLVLFSCRLLRRLPAIDLLRLRLFSARYFASCFIRSQISALRHNTISGSCLQQGRA